MKDSIKRLPIYQKFGLLLIVFFSVCWLVQFFFISQFANSFSNRLYQLINTNQQVQYQSDLNKYVKELSSKLSERLDYSANLIRFIGKHSQTQFDQFDENYKNVPSSFYSYKASDFKKLKNLRILKNGDLKTSFYIWNPGFSKNGKIKDSVRKHVYKTSFFDNLFANMIDSYYEDPINLFYNGPPSVPYSKSYPNYDANVVNYENLYKGFAKNEYWGFFSKKLLVFWKKAYEKHKNDKDYDWLTITPPYIDAGGLGFVITMMYPFWDKKTGKFDGAVALDLSFEYIHGFLDNIQFLESGFAFLVNSKKEIVAINAHGEEILGLKDQLLYIRKPYINRDLYIQPMSKSKIKEFAALSLPKGEVTSFQKVSDLEQKKYTVILKKISSLNYLSENGIEPQSLILGLMIPEDEIRHRVQDLFGKTNESFRSFIERFQIYIAVLSLIILAVLSFVSFKLLNPITLLKTRLISGTSVKKGETFFESGELAEIQGGFEEAQQEISLLNRKIESINSERRSFKDDLSHNVKIKLNAVAGLVSSSQKKFEKDIPTSLRENFEKILDNTNQLLKFAEEVLGEKSGLEKRILVSSEPISMSNLISTVENNLSTIAEKNLITFSNQISVEARFLYAKSDNLEKLLTHFLTNVLQESRALDLEFEVFDKNNFVNIYISFEKIGPQSKFSDQLESFFQQRYDSEFEKLIELNQCKFFFEGELQRRLKAIFSFKNQLTMTSGG